MSPAKKQDTHAHVPTYHTALTCIPPTSTHSVLSLSLYNPSPTSEHPCLAQCLAQDRHSTKRMEDKTDGGRGGGRQVLVRPLAHRTEDYRFIFVSAESEPQRLLRLSAVGTVRDSLPSSKQRRGHEGRGSPDPHMDSRHLLPFAHTEAGGWGSSPYDCEQPWKLPCQQAVTANRLGPLHPRSCPRSQPRPPAHAGARLAGPCCQTGAPVTATGAWALEMPPLPPPPPRGHRAGTPEYPPPLPPAPSHSAPPFPGPCANHTGRAGLVLPIPQRGKLRFRQRQEESRPRTTRLGGASPSGALRSPGGQR